MINLREKKASSNPMGRWPGVGLMIVSLIGAGGSVSDTLAKSQKENDPSRIILVSKDEPGEPLVVTGTVYETDGKTPASGITVYVYHTDAEGFYRRGESGSTNPRIKGYLHTDVNGKYEFRTIKPASYPGTRTPSHVHYVIKRNGKKDQYESLMFERDPFINNRDRSSGEDTFARVRPLTRDSDGTWRAVKDVRLK